MKKTISLLLVLVLAFALMSGCAAKPPETPAAPAPAATEAPAPVVEDTAEATDASDGTVEQPDGYPSKTIDYIIPAPAGALVDLSARALEANIDLGTSSVALTNMAGASQTIGIGEVFARKADGYTFASTALAGMICQPLLGNTEYTMDDFRHIAFLQNPEQVLLVTHNNSGLKTFEDFTEALKNGEELLFTCANSGAVAHLALLSICDQLGLPVPTYVSYSGAAEVLNALLGEQVDVVILDVTAVSQYYQSGDLTVLLSVTDEQCARMPDVPYAGEKGLVNMDFFTSPMWVVCKKDTPNEIVEWVKQQINEAVLSEEYQKFLTNSGLDPYTDLLSEEEVTELLTSIEGAYADLYAKYFNN